MGGVGEVEGAEAAVRVVETVVEVAVRVQREGWGVEGGHNIHSMNRGSPCRSTLPVEAPSLAEKGTRRHPP
jgi:hypothetical protein